MRNFIGNHKIGIFGMSDSGKTVFLTSLLWHLENHHPDLFPLSDNDCINGFRLIELKDHDHEFNFRKNMNSFILENRWPAKTTDYSIARCKYKITGSAIRTMEKEKSDLSLRVSASCKRLIVGIERHMCERDISFLDIPGERVSDILIWKAKDYQDWVKSLYRFWAMDPKTERIMKEFRDRANDPEKTLSQLEEDYKRAMWFMIDEYCPITPSTYHLGMDGSMLGDKMNSDRETAIRERPIWRGGNLLPLPETWGAKHPEEYKKMKEVFRAYRKHVLKPLFDEIKSCDNYIFCIDIPRILNNGPTYLLHVRETFRDFIYKLAPNRITRILDSSNPTRLAYVATKSDMVQDNDRLESLLKDFCCSLTPAGIKHKCLTCSACVSSEDKTKSGIRVKVGKDIYNPNELLILEQKKLPETFTRTWDPDSYNFPKIAPQPQNALCPPKQNNLNKVFEFIIEGLS